jgi:hypothetical protein
MTALSGARQNDNRRQRPTHSSHDSTALLFTHRFFSHSIASLSLITCSSMRPLRFTLTAASSSCVLSCCQMDVKMGCPPPPPPSDSAVVANDVELSALRVDSHPLRHW